MVKLNLEKVTVCYRHKKEIITAVRDISFTVETGDFAVLVGPSGCGKTTILKTIAGLIAYDEGRIYFDGIDADRITIKERNLSYVPQNYALYPHLTIYENIALPLKAARVPVEEITERVEAVAMDLEISFLLSRKPRHLSGGQQQRVALARSFVKRPDIYLMDEPFSNLEPDLHRRLRHELIKMHGLLRATVILATHDIEDAFALATQIIVMNENGTVAQSGPPTEIFRQPVNRYVADFINTKGKTNEKNI